MNECGNVARLMILLFLVTAGLLCGAETVQTPPSDRAPEPDVNMALAWWPPMENVYTPVGWKNHLFRFNVYYNGMIMANPVPEPDVKALAPWEGLGVQLSIMPSEKGEDPDRWRAGTYQMSTDNGRRWSYQGLLDRPTPVIWNEWRQSFRSAIGFILRQEVFAHVPGGREIETGTEPLYAWVRLSIREVNPLMKPDPCVILVRINKPHIFPEMYQQRNCALRRTDALYTRQLSLAPAEPRDTPGAAAFIAESGGKVRLAILPGDSTATELRPPKNGGQDWNLLITIPATKGSHVDLVVPMLPATSADMLNETRFGRDAALAECDAYWSKVPPTAARIDTPEPYVNEYIRRNAQYGELIAQRMPDGRYTNLTGSLVYARMWATPTTMFDTMLLDTLGLHDAVDRYLETYRAAQGTVKPPGPAYDVHPGYFGGPKVLAAIDWLSDHGAIMHAAAYHALIADDREFAAKWTEPLVKACEFIRYSRSLKNHDGVPGVLAPAIATDQFVPTQAVWNIGWHYRGLASAVRLLERLGHPRAKEFAAEAEDYRQVFVRALREAAEKTPTWTDSAGREHHLVPTSLSAGGDLFHGFYLDTGPLFLVYAGLLPADDPLMRSALAFFREGPNHLVFDPAGHFEQPPVLIHELSSCEPPASFNLFHSHQLADRRRFLEGMYSMLTGAHSRQTYIASETRGGVAGIAGHIGIHAIRLCAIDDLVEPEALHLLRLVPKAWLKADRQTKFENVPTVFGPVTVRFGLQDAGRTLAVEYQGRFHHPPARMRLHMPPVATLSRVIVNGKPFDTRPGEVLGVPPR